MDSKTIFKKEIIQIFNSGAVCVDEIRNKLNNLVTNKVIEEVLAEAGLEFKIKIKDFGKRLHREAKTKSFEELKAIYKIPINKIKALIYNYERQLVLRKICKRDILAIKNAVDNKKAKLNDELKKYNLKRSEYYNLLQKFNLDKVNKSKISDNKGYFTWKWALAGDNIFGYYNR